MIAETRCNQYYEEPGKTKEQDFLEWTQKRKRKNNWAKVKNGISWNELKKLITNERDVLEWMEKVSLNKIEWTDGKLKGRITRLCGMTIKGFIGMEIKKRIKGGLLEWTQFFKFKIACSLQLMLLKRRSRRLLF